MLALDVVFDGVNVLATATPDRVIFASTGRTLRVVCDLVFRGTGIGDGRDKVDSILFVDPSDSCDFQTALFAGINASRDPIGVQIKVAVFHEYECTDINRPRQE